MGVFSAVLLLCVLGLSAGALDSNTPLIKKVSRFLYNVPKLQVSKIGESKIKGIQIGI